MLPVGAGFTSQALRLTSRSGARQRTGEALGAVMVPIVVRSQEVRRATDAHAAPRARG